MTPTRARIGFVATRLAGTDGVSLEVEKWARCLEALGHKCFYFSGESDRPPGSSSLVPEAHFQHPEIERLTSLLFAQERRSADISVRVQALKDHLKAHLVLFLERFGIHLLIAENVLSLPLNIPLALAFTEVVAETRMPAVGHHHDFSWERKRFLVNAAGDYLRTAFPPYLPSLRHVVINSFAGRQLGLRTGASSLLIPNVVDFESPPPAPDAYARRLREKLGIPADSALVLQPTRVVPRKRIELAIELVRRLELPAVLVVTHASGDEGSDYQRYLQDAARRTGVDVRFISELIRPVRGAMADGKDVFSLSDAYSQSDLVTYPSQIEGFGNAFLETIHHRRPIVLSTYEIFRTDIQPKGFHVIGFDDFIGDDTVLAARRVLQDRELARQMAEHNYELGRRHYSFQVLEKLLTVLVQETLGL